MDNDEVKIFAAVALFGMLMHPARYVSRPGASANWHEAIAEEAFQIGEAMVKEAAKHK